MIFFLIDHFPMIYLGKESQHVAAQNNFICQHILNHSLEFDDFFG